MDDRGSGGGGSFVTVRRIFPGLDRGSAFHSSSTPVVAATFQAQPSPSPATFCSLLPDFNRRKSKLIQDRFGIFVDRFQLDIHRVIFRGMDDRGSGGGGSFVTVWRIFPGLNRGSACHSTSGARG